MMTSIFPRSGRTLLAAGVISALAGGAFAAALAPSMTPSRPQPATDNAKEPERIGDPYPLDSCPISGKKLGAMGDPVLELYDGREVRFCCDACPPAFAKDTAKSLAKLDDKLIKDQAPIYATKASVVTGKDLPEKPYEFVYGNRLIRLGAEPEKAEFLKDPKRYLKSLDAAVIAAQGKAYPLTKCPVSGDEYGDMGEPKDLVIAGRLIRLCCPDCKDAIEKNPSKFIAIVDEARKGKPGAPDAGPKDHK